MLESEPLIINLFGQDSNLEFPKTLCEKISSNSGFNSVVLPVPKINQHDPKSSLTNQIIATLDYYFSKRYDVIINPRSFFEYYFCYGKFEINNSNILKELSERFRNVNFINHSDPRAELFSSLLDYHNLTYYLINKEHDLNPVFEFVHSFQIQ